MKKQVILVGAATLKDISFLKEHQEDSFLVACDGGYRAFQEAGIEPDLLVGDFDTFDAKEIGHPKDLIRLKPIKDDSDTYYTIRHLLHLGYHTFHLYGCYGGKSDHFLANIQTLSYLSNQGAEAYLHSDDDETILFCLTNSSVSFHQEAKGRFSVFSLTDTSIGVTEEGYQYTLKDRTLDNLTPLGLSNEFFGGENKTEVKTGRLLLVVPKSFLF